MLDLASAVSRCRKTILDEEKVGRAFHARREAPKTRSSGTDDDVRYALIRHAY